MHLPDEHEDADDVTGGVGDKITPLTKDHTPILSTYEDVTLHGKGDLINVVKLRMSKWGDYLAHLDGPNVIAKGLRSEHGRWEGQAE